MRKVIVVIEVPLSLSATWELLTNTTTYPYFIAYLKKIEQTGKLKKGVDWYDVTTVMWVPLRVKHTVTQFRKNKEFTNKLTFPFNGWMIQKFILKKNDKSTLIHAQLTFDLGNNVANTLIGPIHERRIRLMMDKTARNLNIFIKTSNFIKK